MSKDVYNTSRSIEKMRVQMNGRLSATDRQVDVLQPSVIEFYERMERQLREWEQELDLIIQSELPNFPVYDYWLKHVKGVGPTMAAHLLNQLLPPLPDRGVGTWFHAAGLYPNIEDNRMPHPVKGTKVTYNRWLRRCIWLQADIFTKVGGYYKTKYLEQCKRLTLIHTNDPLWNDPHIHAVARWSSVKLFLSHLYEAWLISENKPYERKVYAERVLGHQYIPVPQWDGTNKI